MESWRPISLINEDAKIFTVNLANRLNSFIGKYIGKDQNGFIQGGQISDLIRRVLNLMYLAKETNSKVGLYIFKAFDLVEWDALKLVIKHRIQYAIQADNS